MEAFLFFTKDNSMKLFLYYRWEDINSKTVFVDFKIFQGNHLDRKENDRFKIENLIFDLTETINSNSIVSFKPISQQYKVVAITENVFKNIDKKLVEMIFLGYEKLS